MRFLVTALALFALLAPPAASAAAGRVDTFATRDALTHGIAGDERYVFVTEPGIGVAPNGARVVALDRSTRPRGRRASRAARRLQAPVHAARAPHRPPRRPGQRRLPARGPPVVYDYRTAPTGALKATLTRTTSFEGQPLAFAEDVEVLPNGEYVVSESISGGLWLIGRDGKIRRGLVPDDGAPPCPSSARAGQRRGADGRRPAVRRAERLPPGAGSLAVRGTNLYISSTCQGGIQRLPISVLLDDSKPAAERAKRITSVTTTQERRSRA